MNETSGSRGSFWQFINSPIIVAFFAIALWLGGSSFILKYKARYFIHAVQNAATSMNSEGKGAVKQMVSGFLGQVVEGVKEAFQSAKDSQLADEKEFLAIKPQIKVSQPTEAATSWAQQQKYVGQITNSSNVSIKQIHINITFYDKNGALIDVADKWLSEVKILAPNETIGFSIERSLGQMNDDKALLENRKAKSMKATVSKFEIFKPQ